MTYIVQLTPVGLAKYSDFTSGGPTLDISHVAVGDQGGAEVALITNQADLLNELYRAHVSRVYNDPSNSSRKLIELTIPPNVGGFWIREASVVDVDGDVVAVANLPSAFKADPASGSSSLRTIRLGLIVANVAGLTEAILDSSTVLATREFVDDQISALPLSWPEADRADEADHATLADSATNATNATTASNSTNLGGHAASYFATQTAMSTAQSDISTNASNIATNTSAISAIAGVPTGVEFGFWGTTAPTGYVLGSGRTIGNASSGATERANADTSALFTMLWTSGTNTTLPIQTSAGAGSTRGASAAADFSANKRLTLPDLRGRVGVGKDDMGGSAASRMTTGGSGVDGSVVAATGGAETHTLTTPQIPAHAHGVQMSIATTITPSAAGFVRGAFDSNANFSTNTGGGGAHNNVQPSVVRNVIIKL